MMSNFWKSDDTECWEYTLLGEDLTSQTYLCADMIYATTEGKHEQSTEVVNGRERQDFLFPPSTRKNILIVFGIFFFANLIDLPGALSLAELPRCMFRLIQRIQ